MKHLVFLLLVGCAATPTVELPAQLPRTVVSNKNVIPQPHILTEEERISLMHNIDETSAKINVHYMDFWRATSSLYDYINDMQLLLRRKMQQAITLQEFKQYRENFYECVNMTNMLIHNSNIITERLLEMKQQFGPQDQDP